jgi:hypothetical protein
VLIASGFVATGYITLTFYDVFALRAIGQRSIPYRIAALANFIGYSDRAKGGTMERNYRD